MTAAKSTLETAAEATLEAALPAEAALEAALPAAEAALATLKLLLSEALLLLHQLAAANVTGMNLVELKYAAADSARQRR